MVLAPFWFSMEYLWKALTPFWFSADDEIRRVSEWTGTEKRESLSKKKVWMVHLRNRCSLVKIFEHYQKLWPCFHNINNACKFQNQYLKKQNKKNKHIFAGTAVFSFKKRSLRQKRTSWQLCISSIESQKGANNVQRCFIENQKGAIAAQSPWHEHLSCSQWNINEQHGDLIKKFVTFILKWMNKQLAWAGMPTLQKGLQYFQGWKKRILDEKQYFPKSCSIFEFFWYCKKSNTWHLCLGIQNIDKFCCSHPRHQKTSNLLRITLKGTLRFYNEWSLEGATYINLW